jgi:cleavage and polyadenylation specificity factor subunit 1
MPILRCPNVAVYQRMHLLAHLFLSPCQQDGRVQFLCPQLLRVDYENRCAVCLIYDRKLAVLPFISSSLRQQPTNKRSDRAQGNESFIIDLPAIGISHIKDFVFLHGYYEPTLMFLYEPVGTWVGFVAPLGHNCRLHQDEADSNNNYVSN